MRFGAAGSLGDRNRTPLVEQVADVEALADVMPAHLGVVENLLAVAVDEDAPLADQVAAVRDFQGLAKLVVGQRMPML